MTGTLREDDDLEATMGVLLADDAIEIKERARGRAAELGEHAKDRAQHLAHDLVETSRQRYAKQAKKANRKVQKLERKLERVSKKLPVDTPLDRRRRSRNRRRGAAGGGGALLIALTVGVAAYLVWRVRHARSGTAEPGRPAPRTAANGEGAYGEASTVGQSSAR